MEDGYIKVEQTLSALLRGVVYETDSEIENSKATTSKLTSIVVETPTSIVDENLTARPMRKKSIPKGHRRSRSVDPSSTILNDVNKISPDFRALMDDNELQPVVKPPKPKAQFTFSKNLPPTKLMNILPKEEPETTFIPPPPPKNLQPKQKHNLITRTVSSNVLVRKRSGTTVEMSGNEEKISGSPRKRRKSPPPSVKISEDTSNSVKKTLKQKLSFRLPTSSF